MQPLRDIVAFCLASFMRRCVLYPVTLLLLRIADAVGGFKAKLRAKRIGSLRLFAPEICAKAMSAAIDKLKQQDEKMYGRLIVGKKLRVLGGSDVNALFLNHGDAWLGIRFTVRTQDALVSFFVFWFFFQENNSIWERANKKRVSDRMSQAALKSAEWLESKNYSAELVQWMKSGGLAENIFPPVTPKK